MLLLLLCQFGSVRPRPPPLPRIIIRRPLAATRAAAKLMACLPPITQRHRAKELGLGASEGKLGNLRLRDWGLGI